jgi:hypothetical protein
MSREANKPVEAWYWVWQQGRTASYLKGIDPGDVSVSYMKQEHGDMDAAVYIVEASAPTERHFAMVDLP